jgi:ketosteroid isomerase-like protein
VTRSAIEIVREGFEALQAGDLDRMLALTCPDVEFLPLAATHVEGRPYRGHDGLRAWYGERLATWSVHYRLDELVERGGRILAHGAMHARGASSGVELDTGASWVVEVRDGKLARIEAFRDRAEAERAALA